MKIHMVKKGDTLVDLASKYKVELNALIALNPQIEDPDKIDVGMKVKIPTGPQPVEPPSSHYVHKHIVKQGDTLWKLGKAWEVPLQAMVKANPQLKNPNVLMTGEVVYIPKQHKLDTGYEAPMNIPPAIPFPPAMPTNLPPEYPMMPEHKAPIVADISNPMVPVSEPNPVIIPAPMKASVKDYSDDLNAGYSDWLQKAESFPHMESKLMDEELNLQLPPAAPQEVSSVIQSPDLNVPYHQAQHPFEQFHIKATEVFAYPSPGEYSGGSMVSNLPQIPQMPQMPQMPTIYAGALPYSAPPAHLGHPGYSDGGCGCGCGGDSYMPAMTQPWYTYPAYSPMAMPYSPYPVQPVSGLYPNPMMSDPCYPLTGEFHSVPAPLPAYGMGHLGMGMPYPTSLESVQHSPQVQIHQWTGNENVEMDMDREVSAKKTPNKPAGKSTASTKKTKSSSNNNDSITSFRKQHREESAEPKPNIPWINV